MNWREKYAHKIVTPAEAISHIRSGDTIHSTMYSSSTSWERRKTGSRA